MSKRQAWYIAHPVAGDVPANLARALRWFKALQRAWPDVDIWMPWYADALANGDSDPVARADALARDTRMVARFDGLVAVGGHVSNGMRVEMEAAERHGVLVLDWTELGEEPPKTLEVRGLYHPACPWQAWTP